MINEEDFDTFEKNAINSDGAFDDEDLEDDREYEDEEDEDYEDDDSDEFGPDSDD